MRLTFVRATLLILFAAVSASIISMGAMTIVKGELTTHGTHASADKPRWKARAFFKDGIFHFSFTPPGMLKYRFMRQDVKGSLNRPTCYITRSIFEKSVGETISKYGVVLSVPCLFGFAAVLGFFPVYSVSRGPLRRLNRRRRGLCVGCGYNLMGNSTGICPECGRTI